MVLQPQNGVTLGQFIEQARVDANLSYRQLAAASGVSLGAIQRLIKDEVSEPVPSYLVGLAGALDIEPSDILAFIGIELPSPRAYFRRKFGVNAEQAEILTQLAEDYSKRTEGNHEDTYKGGDEQAH